VLYYFLEFATKIGNRPTQTSNAILALIRCFDLYNASTDIVVVVAFLVNICPHAIDSVGHKPYFECKLVNIFSDFI